MGAELFHTDGRTDGRRDMTKLRVAFFYNFANAPKNELEGMWKEVVVATFWALPYKLRGGT